MLLYINMNDLFLYDYMLSNKKYHSNQSTFLEFFIKEYLKNESVAYKLKYIYA